MKRHEIISSLFWLIVGLVLTILSATYPLGDFSQPGTGFLPLGLGILLIIFSVVLLVKALRFSADKGQKVPLFTAQSKKVLYAVVVFVAAVFSFEKVGYLLTFLFLGVLVTTVTRWMTWKASIVFAVLSVLGIYVIFVWLLKQPLPTGFLGV
jgi:putative tricarboxylic transport membrane protein